MNNFSIIIAYIIVIVLIIWFIQKFRILFIKKEIESNVIHFINFDKITIESPSIETCSICLDDMDADVIKLKCNHNFHDKCIKKWILTDYQLNNNKCPLCKDIIWFKTITI